MTQPIAKLMRWTVMAFGTVALLMLMPWSFLAGNVMARIDLARGHVGMLDSGPPTMWSTCAATVLQEGNGMEMLPIALCGISSAEAHFEHGYNAAMHGAMQTRGVHDVHNGSAHRVAFNRNRDHPLPRQ